MKVDHGARVDLDDLRSKLQGCLDDKVPVYAVVAIMGSTEEGSVDPLGGIIKLRSEFQKKGLSFLVHGDAAWVSASPLKNFAYRTVIDAGRTLTNVDLGRLFLYHASIWLQAWGSI